MPARNLVPAIFFSNVLFCRNRSQKIFAIVCFPVQHTHEGAQRLQQRPKRTDTRRASDDSRTRSQMSKRPSDGDAAMSQKSARTQVLHVASGGAGGAGVSAGRSATAATQQPAAKTLASGAANANGDSQKNFRYYMQIFVQGAAWSSTAEKDAWIELDMMQCHVRFDLNSGVNFFFASSDFKIVPYASDTTTISIYDSDICGVTNVAPGYSLEWAYDRMFYYNCGAVKRAFMIVRVPVSHPFTKLASSEVERMVRDKFKFSGPVELNKPCWLPFSMTQRQRDYWMEMYENTTKEHKELQKSHALLEGRLNKKEIAIKEIRSALECPQCMSPMDPDIYCFVSNCGHMLCANCYVKNVDRKIAAKCGQCNGTNTVWNKFYGMTFIAEALEKIGD